MARPRKDAGEAGADARIVDAFWQLLAEKGNVADVSAGAVAERAGCNRGTFYYHFKSMDALVERALRQALLDDGSMVDALFRVMVTGDLGVLERADLADSMRRVNLALGSGIGADVNALVRAAIVRRWEEALFGGKRELSSDSCFMVQFMLSGVMSYLLAVGHVTASEKAGVSASASAGTAPMRPRPPADHAFSYVEKSARGTVESVAAAEGIAADEAAQLLRASLGDTYASQ